MKSSVLLTNIVSCGLIIVAQSLPPALHAQSILRSWPGPGPGYPPDPHGAPGPLGVLSVINTVVTYFDKNGAILWGPTNYDSFFGSVGNTGQGTSDPRALFDPDTGRFFFVHQENTGSGSFLNLAVSRNAHPLSGTPAHWRLYRINMTESFGGFIYGSDYPGLAVDSQALYVTYNMFQLSNSPPPGCTGLCGPGLNAQLIALNKAQLAAGTLSGYNPIYLGGGTIQPCTVMDVNGPGNVLYLLSYADRTHLQLYAVNDPLGGGTVNSTSITVPDSGAGLTNNAPQAGTSTPVPVGGGAQGNAFWNRGTVWVCFTSGPPNGPAKVFYYRIRPNGYPNGTPALVESGTVGDPTFWNYQPSIGGNNAGDVCITYTRSSSSSVPTMMYAYRSAGDSGFGLPQVVRISGGFFTGGRWGDYASVWPDPVDGTFWITHEYSISTNADDVATWWAEISTPPYDLYVNAGAGNPELGSVTFPFRTVTKAANQTTHGSMNISGGHYNERVRIGKAVTLRAPAGTVFIGRP